MAHLDSRLVLEAVAPPSRGQTALDEPQPFSKPWQQTTLQVLGRLGVDPNRGLSTTEATQRLLRFGPNRLREIKRRSVWLVLLDQFRSLLVWLLFVAAVLGLLFGQFGEALAIMCVLLINASIGFVTELKAYRSMEALRRLGDVSANVRRDDKSMAIDAARLVLGDIVLLEAGDVVTADLRLLEASKLQSDESMLTGESMPVSKTIHPVRGKLLAERKNMLYKGASVTRGYGRAVVVASGMHTEIGLVSELVQETVEKATPLEQRLTRLGHGLVWITLVIVSLVAAVGIAMGREIFPTIETAIALAVASVPEGLPIIATIALARGMVRMSRQRAIVNRLSSVETLGATSVLLTDKTGTLTENEMTVVYYSLPVGVVKVTGSGAFVLDGQPCPVQQCAELRRALDVGALCNNASFGAGDGTVGDPLEIALLVAAEKGQLDRSVTLENLPEVRQEAFDPDVKMMATVHALEQDYWVAVKGAPEAVLDACTHRISGVGKGPMAPAEKNQWLDENRRLASQGLRVLALATKTITAPDAPLYQELVFVGLVALLDPPRADIKDTVMACRKAGLRVVMVTGDQSSTALTIARAVGIVDQEDADVIQGSEVDALERGPASDRAKLLGCRIFARVSPKEKLRLIALHQAAGAIVAMTGDGVNDAPALKKANIGVAMGKRGTAVAKEAADMVLEDDALSTIVFAIAQGRIIFDNIRSFVVYLLSCNVGEILVVALATAGGAPLPLLPLQILFLNLITDVFPALALGVSEGDRSVMTRLPRPGDEPLLPQKLWYTIGGYGLLMAAVVLGAFSIARGPLHMPIESAVTVTFLSLAFAQLWHVFNMRSAQSSVFVNEVTRNRYVWAALLLCSFLVVTAVFVPALADVLALVPPSLTGWVLIAVASLLPLVIGQLWLVLGGSKSSTANLQTAP